MYASPPYNVPDGVYVSAGSAAPYSLPLSSAVTVSGALVISAVVESVVELSTYLPASVPVAVILLTLTVLLVPTFLSLKVAVYVYGSGEYALNILSSEKVTVAVVVPS